MTQELRNVFDKVYLTITEDHENRWIYTNWFGYLTEDNIKAGALAYTRAIRETGFRCVLNDTSNVIGSWGHSLDWVVNVWSPQAADAGIRHFAMITTPETFAQSTASDFYSTITAFEVKVSDNIESARQWLRQHSFKFGRIVL